MGLYGNSKDNKPVIEADTKGKSAEMKELEIQTESSSSSGVYKIKPNRQNYDKGNAKNDTELNNSEDKVVKNEAESGIKIESISDLKMRIESTDNKKTESKIQIKNKDTSVENKEKSKEPDTQKNSVRYKEVEIQLEGSEFVEESETEPDKKKTKSKWYTFGIDEDRDPKNINGNLKFGWTSLFAEPEDIRSLSFGWRLARGIFQFTETLIYVILTLVLGPIFALAFAIIAAFLAFLQIWCWGPSVGICNMICEAAPCSDKVRSCFETLGNYFKPKPNTGVPGVPGAPGGDVIIDVPIVDQPVMVN